MNSGNTFYVWLNTASTALTMLIAMLNYGAYEKGI